MKQAFHSLSGFVLGITPLFIVVVLAAFFRPYLGGLPSIFVFATLIVFTIWVGVQIYSKVQTVGPLEFITGQFASPQLDNLELSSESDTFNRTPGELAKLISDNQNLLKGGTIRIYNDWFGEPHDNYLVIGSAIFDSERNVLTIGFKPGIELEIHAPGHIQESATFLKIIDAESIKLNFLKRNDPDPEHRFYLDYVKGPKAIETSTNLKGGKTTFDVTLGSPALMVYG